MPYNYRCRYVKHATHRCGDEIPKVEDRRIDRFIFAGELLDAREAEFVAHSIVPGHDPSRGCIVDLRDVANWTYGGRRRLAAIPREIRRMTGASVPILFLVPQRLAAWVYPLPRKRVVASLEEAKRSICDK